MEWFMNIWCPFIGRKKSKSDQPADENVGSRSWKLGDSDADWSLLSRLIFPPDQQNHVRGGTHRTPPDMKEEQGGS